MKRLRELSKIRRYYNDIYDILEYFNIEYDLINCEDERERSCIIQLVRSLNNAKDCLDILEDINYDD